MPPSRTKPKAEALILRFRETVRRERISRFDMLALLNKRYFRKEEPVSLDTLNKWLYGPAGKNVSADSALALQSFVSDYTR